MELRKLLRFLKCPYCPNDNLKLRDAKIECSLCQTVFEVVEGVPVLMKKENLGKQEKKQKKWFDQHYGQFSQKKYRPEKWRLSMLKRIFNTSFRNKIGTYLDIGCGAAGYTLIEAAKITQGMSFGVDVSLEAVLKAKEMAERQGLAERTGFLICSANNLPFKANLFDYVSAASVLEHLENDGKVIKDVYGLLKKEGHFFVCVPNTYNKIWPFLWPIYLYLDWRVGHKRHYSLEGLSHKMKKYGPLNLESRFYNGHLIKLGQMIRDKIGLMDEKKWWEMEKKDINQNPMALQLNAIYRKLRS